jgi:hypothetical protein
MMSTGNATCGFINAPTHGSIDQAAAAIPDTLLCKLAPSGAPMEALRDIMLGNATVNLA